MKRVGYSILFILSAYTGLVGCKKENKQKDLLVSEWKLTEWTLMPEMSAKISDSLKTELMKSATMEFTADNKFIFKGMSPNPVTGTYKLWENGRTLTLTPDNGQESYNHTIQELTDTKLVLIDPMGNNLVCTH